MWRYGVPPNIEGETLLASPDETTKLRLMFNMKYLVNSSDTIYHANYYINDSFTDRFTYLYELYECHLNYSRYWLKIRYLGMFYELCRHFSMQNFLLATPKYCDDTCRKQMIIWWTMMILLIVLYDELQQQQLQPHDNILSRKVASISKIAIFTHKHIPVHT